jgi:hypothetical protein
MKKRCVITVCLLSMILSISIVHAQDWETYAENNGTLYLQPLADAFGANMNGGIFHGAKITKSGFHATIGVVAMGAIIAEDQQTFLSKGDTELGLDPGKTLPTIFGNSEPVTFFNGTEDIELPGGLLETNIVPFGVPQLTIGNVFGTRAIVRWIELSVNEDIGKIGLFGIGGQHSISQHFAGFPVDVAVGYFWQSFTVGDFVEAHATYLGLNVGYSLSILHFYGGLGYETATLDVHYEQEVDGGASDPFVIEFSMKGANKMRGTIGLLLDLPVVKIYVDYNVAAQNTVTAGLGFGL